MSNVPEPPMDPSDWSDLQRGVALFNAGEFWHAHEAWETVWRRKRALPAHIFLKGLIQLAAAHHQREQGRHQGMLIHFERARTKLTPFAPEFLGVAVTPLLASLHAGQQEAERVGRDHLADFDRALVPVMQWSAIGGGPGLDPSV